MLPAVYLSELRMGIRGLSICIGYCARTFPSPNDRQSQPLPETIQQAGAVASYIYLSLFAGDAASIHSQTIRS